MFRSQIKMPMEGILCIKVDTSAFKIRIKFFLRFPILRIELMNVVSAMSNGFTSRLGFTIRVFRSVTGMFSNLLQTRFTSLSGDISAWYSVKKCGCSLMKEMML